MTPDALLPPALYLRAIALYLLNGQPAPGLVPDDLVVRDTSDGALSLRSLAALRRGLATSLPDHCARVEDGLWHPASGETGTGLVRLIVTATHSRDGPMGPASHRRLSYRTALVLHRQDNRLSEAVLIRDRRPLIEMSRSGWPRLRPRVTTNSDPTTVQTNQLAWAGVYADVLTTAMEGDFSVFHRGYDPAVELSLPGGATGYGTDAADRFWLGLRGAVPTGDFTIIGAADCDEPLSPPRAALQWRLSGRHSGWGMFGAPTGGETVVEGVSFAEFGPRGIRREWTILDEGAVLGRLPLRAGSDPISAASCPASG